MKKKRERIMGTDECGLGSEKEGKCGRIVTMPSIAATVISRQTTCDRAAARAQMMNGAPGHSKTASQQRKVRPAAMKGLTDQT